MVMTTEPESSERPTAPNAPINPSGASVAAARAAGVRPTRRRSAFTRGRELVARARCSIPGGCVPQRVAALLHTRRMGDAEFTAALREAAVVAHARQYLEQGPSRGVTTEEREAALAWLDEQVAGADTTSDVPATTHPAVTVRTPESVQRGEPSRRQSQSAPVHPRRPSRNGAGSRATITRAKPLAPAKTKPLPPPPHAAPGRPSTPTLLPDVRADVALDQVDELTRQQQRILRRSTVLETLLEMEARVGNGQVTTGDPRTLGEAVAELVHDIIVAARTIGTILQQVGDRRQA